MWLLACEPVSFLLKKPSQRWSFYQVSLQKSHNDQNKKPGSPEIKSVYGRNWRIVGRLVHDYGTES